MFFNDLTQKWAPCADQLHLQWRQALQSGSWIQGPSVQRFESELAHVLRAPLVKSCGSGSDALWLALELAGIGPGDEVILPPLTFAATLQAIWRVGATPVFADIQSETWTLDPEQVLAVLSDQTKAIIAVNLAGLPADLIELQAISREFGLVLIEDGAQGFGSEIQWRPTSFYADLSTQSFFPSKNLGACGDGGGLVVSTDFINKWPQVRERILASRPDEDWASIFPTPREYLDSLCNQGLVSREGKQEVMIRGWNSRLDSIQALALLELLQHMKSQSQLKLEWRERFEAFFEALESDHVRFRLQRVPEDVDVHWSLLGVWVDRGRDSLVDFLQKQGVPARVYYDPLLHQSALVGGAGRFETAEKLAQGWFCLPFHAHLSEDDFSNICDALLEWRDNFSRDA